MTHLCNDYGDSPTCEREADERYTMDYTDIGEGYIYWCARCGQVAHAMNEALVEAMRTRPGFIEELREAIEHAKAEIPQQ
jgi:hypothetical protein